MAMGYAVRARREHTRMIFVHLMGMAVMVGIVGICVIAVALEGQ